ncbi:hypothetical protein GAYE_PCTG10G0459 [Galdieria yellowstonensis]|uniref:S1-like domain-containing protein n=1 Tax=Galdieria yellowstonensis TaxID=3028027 RepID=A0AAV9I655_9RHOD|nr:hypothetical protein GAYE_PCTG10G0459 [Galdieria yellowstonensis]
MFTPKPRGNGHSSSSSSRSDLQLEPGQYFGRVVQALGNNVYQVETREPEKREEKYLLPKRLRNYIYIRRGSVVIVELYESAQGRVRGEIVETFLPDDIKTLYKQSEWPQEWKF